MALPQSVLYCEALALAPPPADQAQPQQPGAQQQRRGGDGDGIGTPRDVDETLASAYLADTLDVEADAQGAAIQVCNDVSKTF